MYSKDNYLKQKTMLMLVCFLFASINIGWSTNKSNKFTAININAENATLTEVFSLILNQTAYRFSYGNDIIEDKSTYSVSCFNASIQETLDDLSHKAQFNYTINDNIVLVKKSTQTTQQTIKGTVLDENNEVLAWANVTEVGTTNGVVTDTNGNFSINLTTENPQLQISFIGYESQILSINNQTIIKVQLQLSSDALNEVVVVGYGKQTKADVTGALSKISEENFRQGINTSPDNLLQGKIAGVRIVNSSGEPGAGVDVIIRGVGSIRSGSTPLFVVDGVPLTNDAVIDDADVGFGTARAKNPLNFLNPNDIESINVLKDASAASIYGARGSNGVIIITTKKGAKGEANITLDSYIGISSIANKLDVLNAEEYKNTGFYNIWDNDGNEIIDYTPTSTDWQDIVFRNAITTSNNLSYSKGSEKGNYYVSVSHMGQEGIVEDSKFERLSGRINVSESFLDDQRLKVKVNLTASETEENAVPTSDNAGAGGELILHTISANPTKPVYDEKGEFYVFGVNANYNPALLLDMHEDITKTLRVLGNIESEFRIVNGLTYKFNYGVDRAFAERNATIFQNGTDIHPEGEYYQFDNESLSTLLEHYLTFTYSDDNNKLEVLGGFSYQKFEKSGTRINLTDLGSSEIPPANNPVFAEEEGETTGFAEENELQSYFGRINYSYKGKYILTASIRADGSTRFGENNKYGYFPSFALGWNLSREAFLQNSKIIRNLKLRGSWGQTGNQEVPNKITQSSYSLSGRDGYYLYKDGDLVSGTSVNRTANPDLKWEVVRQLNFGLDFELFNGDLYGNIDYYNKVTTDAILNIPTEALNPTDNVWTNIDGEIVNKGLEFMIGYKVFKSKKLSWNIDFNGATLNNEIKDLPVSSLYSGNISGQGQTGVFANIYTNGYSAGSFYLYDHLGFDESGNELLSNEKIIIEGALPSFTYGFNSQMRYKNIDFSFSFTGQAGGYLFNNTKFAGLRKTNLTGDKNITQDVLNSPIGVGVSPKASTYYLEESNYLRLNSARIGYTFKPEKIKWLKQATIYVSGQNLFTITDYSGFDPSVNTPSDEAGNSAWGVDYATYPTARTFIFGATIKL